MQRVIAAVPAAKSPGANMMAVSRVLVGSWPLSIFASVQKYTAIPVPMTVAVSEW